MTITTILTWLDLFLMPKNISATPLYTGILSLSPTVTPTSSSTSTALAQASGGINPAIVAALIGLAGIIVGPLIICPIVAPNSINAVSIPCSPNGMPGTISVVAVSSSPNTSASYSRRSPGTSICKEDATSPKASYWR